MSERLPGRSVLGGAIFMSRWLQVPLYLGLIVAQGVCVVQFLIDLWHLIDPRARHLHQGA